MAIDPKGSIRVWNVRGEDVSCVGGYFEATFVHGIMGLLSLLKKLSYNDTTKLLYNYTIRFKNTKLFSQLNKIHKSLINNQHSNMMPFEQRGSFSSQRLY